MSKLINVEEYLKEIKKKLNDGSSFSSYDETHFLFNEVKRLRAVLNKICSNYYCRFDSVDGESVFDTHNVDCPTCIANRALTKKVKV